MNKTIILYVLAGCVLVILLRKVQMWLQLSRAKHRSLTGHSRMARRFASLVPFYEYDDAHFFRADAAPDAIAATRRAGFMRLAAVFAERFKRTAELTGEIAGSVSDLQFNRLYDLTGSYVVNVFGYDFYKECIEQGARRVRELGPVLGAYHPVTAYNVLLLLQISGLDEISTAGGGMCSRASATP